MQEEVWKMDACYSSLESSWPCFHTSDMPPWWGCLPLVVVTLRGAEPLITAPLQLHGLISQSPATVVIFNVATKETCQSAKWPVWLPGNTPRFIREEAKKTYSSAPNKLDLNRVAFKHKNRQHVKSLQCLLARTVLLAFIFVVQLTCRFTQRNRPTFLVCLLWRPPHGPFDGLCAFNRWGRRGKSTKMSCGRADWTGRWVKGRV